MMIQGNQHGRADEISSRLRSSSPARDLAAEYGVSYEYLLGVVRQRVPVPDDPCDDLAWAVTMFRSGASVAEIARRLGKDRAGVMRRLRGKGYDAACRPPAPIQALTVGRAVTAALQLHAEGALMVDILAALPTEMRDAACRAIYAASLEAVPRRFTPGLAAHILVRYRAGEHARSLADEHGVALSALMILLKGRAGDQWADAVRANQAATGVPPRIFPVP